VGLSPGALQFGHPIGEFQALRFALADATFVVTSEKQPISAQRSQHFLVERISRARAGCPLWVISRY
jgi:hypothetical protein